MLDVQIEENTKTPALEGDTLPIEVEAITFGAHT